MKVPGRAWLELTVHPATDAGSRYRQRAVFLPRGLAGHLYWWAVAPFHGLVFGGMVRNITQAAERDGRSVSRHLLRRVVRRIGGRCPAAIAAPGVAH